MKNFLSRWLPVLLWAALIFWISANPDPYSWLPPGWRNPFNASNPDGVSPDGMIGRVLHVFEYAVLTWLLLRAWGKAAHFSFKEGGWIAIAAAAMLYALSDETHQLFVPNRAFELSDLALDLTGVLAAILLFRIRSMHSERTAARLKQEN